ncbi:hypothetical protein IFM89_037270, partial [Coptis chinensis]
VGLPLVQQYLYQFEQLVREHLPKIKLPFEKLIHALRNFPDEAMDPDILLPMAYSIKVNSYDICYIPVYINIVLYVCKV